MKRLFFILAVILVALTSFAEVPPKFSTVRIFVPDKATLNHIWNSGIDYEGAQGKIGGWMEFVAGEYELAQLQEKGIAYDVVIDDMAKYYEQRLRAETKTIGFGYGSMGGFYTFAEVVQQLDSMRLLYPSLITSKDSIGLSIEGLTLWAVKISDNPETDEDEPEVLYTALHHAREPQGMMTVLYYMWWLLENYGTNAEATYLVNNREMWFIPVVNPDGYVYNQTTNPNGGGMWRKNRRNNGNGTFGVDPNRNYGPMYMWNAPNGGSSTSPSSETYRGTAPFSEPENQSIDNFMRTHTIKTCFNYHTYGNYLIYPWGYLSAENADSLIYREWTYWMQFDNHFTNGTDQQTVNYSTRGNSDDYMFGDTTKPRTYAITPEVGITGFWPSQTEIVPLAAACLTQNKLFAYFAGPYPSLTHITIEDKGGSEFVNANDSFALQLSYKNMGLSNAENLTFTISANVPFIQFSSSSLTIDSISSQTTTQITFNGYVQSDAPLCSQIQVYVETTDPQGLFKRDTITLYLGTPTIIFADSATNGTGNWNTGTGWGTTSNAHTPPFSFTDSPTGNYFANTNNSLTLTSQLDLTDYQYVVLQFWAKWAIEPTWDFATVEISTDNGSTWTTLRTPLSHSGSARGGSQQPAGTWGYDSYTPGLTWVKQEVDLSSYVNQQIKLRFRVAADGGEQRDGFYVDDIRVLGFVAAPVQPTLLFPPDNSSQPPSLTLKWTASAGASSYTLQLSEDSTFASTLINDSLISTTSYSPVGLSSNVTYFWRVKAHNAYAESDWSSVWKFTTNVQAVSISVVQKWNLVSVPLTVSDYSVTALFENAKSPAYFYSPESGYELHDTLDNRRGYWLKFPEAEEIQLRGTYRTYDTIPVVAGWNLIGSISLPVLASSITSDPPAIVTSQFFGFDGGYHTSHIIEAGKGYWVKSNQNGVLILSSEMNTQSSAARIRIIPTSELPPPAPESSSSKLQTPSQFVLQQNYPNPFNPTTVISFQLPVASFVVLKVYNILGEEVCTLVNELLEAGEKSVQFDARNLNSGVYFYRLQAHENNSSHSKQLTQKLVILK